MSGEGKAVRASKPSRGTVSFVHVCSDKEELAVDTGRTVLVSDIFQEPGHLIGFDWDWGNKRQHAEGRETQVEAVPLCSSAFRRCQASFIQVGFLILLQHKHTFVNDAVMCVSESITEYAKENVIIPVLKTLFKLVVIVSTCVQYSTCQRPLSIFSSYFLICSKKALSNILYDHDCTYTVDSFYVLM